MTEIENRVEQRVEHDASDVWEQAVSEWAEGARLELAGRLRQARAAAAVQTRYGSSSMEAFGREVGASRSTVYEYARAYARLLGEFGGHDEISGRLDDSPLAISNVLESTHDEDVRGSLDRAEDEGLTTRQQRRMREERTKPKNVETVTEMVCPACGVVSPMHEVVTREVAR